MVNAIIRSTTTNNQNQSGSSTNTNDIINFKLEHIGFHVGQKLAERITKERPGFPDTLEIIRWLCREFWNTIFKRQIDQLKTNKKGVYVMHDTKFRWLQRFSGSDATVVRTAAERYLCFPCGIIRGVLYSLGVDSVVTAEVSSVPSCIFTIKEVSWRPVQ